jgi:hypothetical protein
MTRVYQNPIAQAAGSARTRALIIGAGLYPHAQTATDARPKLKNLESVGPSIRTFVSKLLGEWFDDLTAPLGSVDLLLSDTAAPQGLTWPGFGRDGEVAVGTVIDQPTLENVKKALSASLQGATVEDHFLFLCCGHGFWKTSSYFVLSDFGANELNIWEAAINLDGFRTGLSQITARNQWLFFDCCKDIPEEILKTLSQIGTPLIETNAAEIAKANRKGSLSQYGLSSAAIGLQAFGIPNKPSRFCEMLIDALDGAGAVSKHEGKWHVDDHGIGRAVRSYAQRNPDLEDPDFYKGTIPISNDMPDRLRFRCTTEAPKSRLVVFSKPRTAMKAADLFVLRDGNPNAIWSRKPAGRAKVLIELPARLTGKVSAVFPDGKIKEIEVYGDLPTAEPDEAEFVV